MDHNGNPILEIKDVTKIYRTKSGLFASRGRDVIALDHISLEINKGEIFGLVGESGSGKTTAGRLIVSLEETDSGEIFMDGKPVTGLKGKKLKKFRSKAQMIFQDPYQSLNPQRSILDTVSEPLAIHRIGHAGNRKDRVRQALKSVGLSPPDDFIYRYPHRLSGGQRQRVAIARAMVLEPEFVIADEPTSMLDASISAQIFNILLKMRNELNVTQLFITHSLAAGRYLCDRIAVMYRGRLMEVGRSDQVIRNPRHPYTKALIDALPKFGHSGNRKRYGTLLAHRRDVAEEVGCNFFSRCALALENRCNLEKPGLLDNGNHHMVACFLSQF
ncbi:ABC transporter, ATP-binding protein [delta proteobacterium NaphS2]|nr:ABC transporter, ATP-binding protein [delta proteobacterium NaphS2]